MNRGRFFILFAAAVLIFGGARQASGQQDRSGSSLDRITGTVAKVDRAKATIHVGMDGGHREVVYNGSTLFTELNRKGSVDAVKEGRVVICRGKLDAQKRLVATRIEVRDSDR